MAGSGLGRIVGWALAHSLWQAGLLTAGLTCILHLLPTSRAALRYRLALGALGLAVLLPLGVSLGLAADWHRHQSCRGPSVVNGRACSGHGRPLDAMPSATPPRPPPAVEPGDASHEPGDASRRPADGLRSRLGILVRVMAVPGTRLLPAAARNLAHDATNLMGWLTFGWMIGLALAAFGLIRSVLAVHRIWRASVPVADREARLALSEGLARMGTEMDVELRATSDVQSPAATWGRPGRILLPAHLTGLLSPSELRAVIAHEIAHLRGRDPQVALAQAAACSTFFLNPFVPALSRMVDREREALRDAQAAEALGSHRRYGETLLTLAGLGAVGAGAGLSGLLGEGDLTRRIRRLGRGARTAGPAGPRTLLAGSLAVLLVAGVVAASATAGTLSSWAVMVDADDTAAALSPATLR